MLNLVDYGWTEFWSERFTTYLDQGFIPGRILFQSHGICRVATEQGELEAKASGRLRHKAGSTAALPLVGDWVALRSRGSARGTAIVGILPRRSKLSRKTAGQRTVEQAVVANIDRVLLMMGLDENFSLRRMERLLVMAWEGDVEPLVLLNKADLCADAAARCLEVEAIAPGVPVLVLSVLDEQGLAALRPYLEPRTTLALMGSSGVGKSSLINLLTGGQVAATGEVREFDGRGRHTTTHREMLRLPGGSLLIDNPGVRELAVWGTEEGLEDTFSEIHALAEDCRFRDCSHADEPGCRVLQELESGGLAADRLQSFLTLQEELRSLKQRRDPQARREQQRKVVTHHRTTKKHKPRQ